jgi:alpha-glucosidase
MRTPAFTPAWVRKNQERRQAECPAGVWPCNTLGNHDSSRLITHYGDGAHDREWNRVLAALMLTLRGTPFLYYGEEIGMEDLPLDDVRQFRDMLGVWFHDALVRVLGRTPAEALADAAAFTRDKCRTPMPRYKIPSAPVRIFFSRRRPRF